MKFFLEDCEVNFESEEFLEFYGALLGDGWISVLKNKKYNKIHYFFGMSGHVIEDKAYLLRIRSIVRKLFHREGYLKYKSKEKAMEFIFGHKELISLFDKELGFPIGLKHNLKIYEGFLDWETVKYVLRGLFDTDGSLYFDKDKRYREPYPIFEISTYSEKMNSQLVEILRCQGFRVIKHKQGVRMKGKDQLKRWFNEIKPANEKHIFKYQKFIKEFMPG